MLDDALKSNPEFQCVLAVFYSDILRYHREAYTFVRRRSKSMTLQHPTVWLFSNPAVSGWVLFFSTAFGRFQKRFEDIIANLKAHEDLLDKTANAVNIAEATKTRAWLQEQRKEQLAALGKEEQEKASRQYWEIAAWLKVDQADQSLVLDCILEESQRFPGGCDWILRNDHLKLWLQTTPSTPFVWLRGKPGSGKSVMAAQILAFLHAANHSLIVSHFCTYSYASSTRYDLVLGSLLLQLIQGNEDLIAYVCKLKDTEFVKRPVSPQALERLIRVLAKAVSKSPGETRYVHIVLDGLDECEDEKQGRLATLLEQLVSTTEASQSTICKVLLFTRLSGSLARRFRKKTTISLAEQGEHLEKAIQSYARHKLGSLRQRFHEMDVGIAEIESMATTLARKADGAFQCFLVLHCNPGQLTTKQVCSCGLAWFFNISPRTCFSARTKYSPPLKRFPGSSMNCEYSVNFATLESSHVHRP